VTFYQPDSSPRQKVSGLALDLSWWVWFVAIAALFFLDSMQRLAATVFMVASMAYALARPGLAIKATLSYWIPWTYVMFAALSVLWSQYPVWTLRASIQFAFTTGVFLVMARALPPTSLLSVYLAAILLADAASLANPRTAWNTGGLALIGIFGSKNSFGLTQALLIQVGVWVLLDHRQRRLMRALALIGVVGGSFLIVAALSVGAVVALFGALACSFLAFNLQHFPRRSRVIILYAGGLLIAILCSFGIVFSDELFQEALQLSGKSTSLSDRTPLWDVASKMMQDHPIGGVGYQAFWQHGNPYAEDLWRRFQPTRAGYHFHNLWYQCGVDLGHIGLGLALLTVAITAIEVMRWVVRSPSPASCFFLGYVVFIILRSMLEVDLFAQFSATGAIFLAAFVYARQSRERYEPGRRVGTDAEERLGDIRPSADFADSASTGHMQRCADLDRRAHFRYRGNET
jgi:exopolysaccharide production protein ExoQ